MAIRLDAVAVSSCVSQSNALLTKVSGLITISSCCIFFIMRLFFSKKLRLAFSGV